MTELQHRKNLPIGWAWTTLDTVTAEIYRYPTFYGLDRVEQGIPVIRGEHINVDGTISHNFSDYWFVSQDTSQNFPKTILRQADLVMTVRGSIGKVGIVDQVLDGAQLSPNCIRISPTYKICDSKYLLHYFHSSFAQESIQEHTNATTIATIKANLLKTLAIPLAPLAEQHRIVEAIETHLTRLDAAVAALKRVQINLKRYRAAVLKAACEGRLVPTEAEQARAEKRDYEPAAVLLARILAERRAKWMAENPGKKYKEPDAPDTSELAELPEGWAWVSAQAIAEVITNGSTPKFPKVTKNSGEIPFLKTHNVTQQGILDFNDRPHFIDEAVCNKELARSVVFPDDVLLNTVGPPIGKSALVPSIFPKWNINQNLTLYRTFKQHCLPKFLVYWFLSPSAKQIIEQLSTATAGQSYLNLGNCRVLPIPLCAITEQVRIVAEVERRLSVTDQFEKTIEANLARAERLRQSILKRAFAGKLVAQDPNDEPAAVLLERIRAARNGRPAQAGLL